jgi:hypothetical protein
MRPSDIKTKIPFENIEEKLLTPSAMVSAARRDARIAVAILEEVLGHTRPTTRCRPVERPGPFVHLKNWVPSRR